MFRSDSSGGGQLPNNTSILSFLGRQKSNNNNAFSDPNEFPSLLKNSNQQQQQANALYAQGDYSFLNGSYSSSFLSNADQFSKEDFPALGGGGGGLFGFFFFLHIYLIFFI